MKLNELESEKTMLRAQLDQTAANHAVDLHQISEKLMSLEFDLQDEKLTTDRLKQAEEEYKIEVSSLQVEIDRLNKELCEIESSKVKPMPHDPTK